MPTIVAEDGSTIHFSVEGSGYPLLFLHGWMMSRKVWHFQHPLSAQFRIISLDLRGHGESEASDFSYSACLNDISELLLQLNIDNTIIVGWSMGSQVAIKASLHLQDKLAGLVLVGGTARFCSTDSYSYGLPSSEARGMMLRLKRDYRGTAGQFFKNMFSETENLHLDLRDIASKTVGRLPHPNISLAALRELTETDLRGCLAQATLPTLLLHGAEDIICPPGASTYMNKYLPHSSCRILTSTGHAPFLSDPENFNLHVSAFVRTVHG